MPGAKRHGREGTSSEDDDANPPPKRGARSSRSPSPSGAPSAAAPLMTALRAPARRGEEAVASRTASAARRKTRAPLPAWLASPEAVDATISAETAVAPSAVGLAPALCTALAQAGYTALFPVQAAVVPRVLTAARSAYPPGDLCVSAPTGSGKTLAYVLPVLQLLAPRVVRRLRAVVVVPTRQLVTQVHAVFAGLLPALEAAEGAQNGRSVVGAGAGRAPLVVAAASGGVALAREQALLQPGADGSGAVDVLVTTPGRLVEHLQHTADFDLRHVRLLVIDEADRLLMQSYQGWLTAVHDALYPPPSLAPPRLDPTLTTAARHRRPGAHVQKLLFSATLSRDPERLVALRLAYPTLLVATQRARGERHDAVEATAGAVGRESSSAVADGEADQGRPAAAAVAGVIPPQLEEHYIECSAQEKPLVLLHCLLTMQMDRTIVFTAKLETTHRLAVLLQLFGGLRVAEVSSASKGGSSSSGMRRLLRRFEAGELNVLVCSDTMARGIDLNNVENVISYDAPSKAITYIHRVGRAARAGARGDAYTLVRPTELKNFRKVRAAIDDKEIESMEVTESHYAGLLERYALVLQELQASLKKEGSVVNRSSEDPEADVRDIFVRQLRRSLLQRQPVADEEATV